MTAVIAIEGLTKRYGSRAAVDGISLTVHRGEVYGFLGPNGAGKTTTLRVLLGLVTATSGRVSVLGETPGSRAALAATGSFVEAPTFYPYLSGRANLGVLATYAGVPKGRVGAVLETVDLADRADDRFSSYSLGMKQRLGVAAALLKDPELVVLDEPTNGLDPAGMRDMRALVRSLGAEGRTVLLSSHLMGEVQQICDRVGVINHGRMVVQSTVADLRAGNELVVAGAPADVARSTLEAMPEVEQVRASGGTLRVRVDEQHTAEVTRTLVTAGVAVTEVRRDERQLEEVFFEMTEREHEAEAHHV